MLPKMFTSKFIYSLVLLLCCSVFAVQAQETAAASRKENTTTLAVAKPHIPLYQGTYIALDIFNPVATAFNGGRFEVSVAADVSLWQRLFPAVELGVMALNQQQDSYRYHSLGGFVKVGANYNFLNFKTDRQYDHIMYAGVRYGYSFTQYQLTDAVIGNNYWKESGTFSNDKRMAHFGWLEILVGVRVQVYKQFFMGVALQVKTFGHYYQQTATYPTYIAGFGGDSQATNFGFLYHLTYQFPYKK